MSVPVGFCIMQLNTSELSLSISKCRKSIPIQLIGEILRHSLGSNIDLSILDQAKFDLSERIMMTDKEYLKLEFSGEEWIYFFDALVSGATGIEIYAKIQIFGGFKYYAVKKKGKKYSGTYANPSDYNLDEHINVVREWLDNIPNKIKSLDPYTFGPESDFLLSNIVKEKVLWVPESDEDYFHLSRDGFTKVLNTEILCPDYYQREYLIHAKSIGVEIFDPYFNGSLDWSRGNCYFQVFLNLCDDCDEDAATITQIALDVLEIFDVKMNEEVGNLNNLPNTALCRAINMGLIKVVKRMVELGADINFVPTFSTNSTPIETAKAANTYMKKYRAMEPSLEGDSEHVNHQAVYEYLLEKVKI